MAFPDPLPLKNASAAVVNFTRRTPVPSGWSYVSTTSTPALSDSVVTRFSVTPKKGMVDGNNRSTITFKRTRVDSDGLDHSASMTLSLVRSHDTDIADSDVTELYALMGEFLIASSGDLKLRFNRGET